MLTCQYCNLTFKPAKTNKNNPQKYCGIECSRAARAKQLTPCIYCNTLTTNPKFCNKSCAAKFNNSAAPKKTKVVKRCATCNTETTRPKYCCNACNPNRLQLTETERAKHHRALHNEAWQRYMAKRKNQTPEGIDIKALRQFYLNCPDGHEVDHIIPVSKGGLHCLANLQYLTISDNRKKSNKIL